MSLVRIILITPKLVDEKNEKIHVHDSIIHTEKCNCLNFDQYVLMLSLEHFKFILTQDKACIKRDLTILFEMQTYSQVFINLEAR